MHIVKESRIKTKPTVEGFVTVWKNDEESKIPIIDGKISFYDESTEAHFELYVRQVKGMGVAAADKLSVVSDKHKAMIEAMSHDEDWHSSDAVMVLVCRLVGQHYFKEQHYRGTLSELVRKKVILIDMELNPPRYRLNRVISKKCLETGKFE